MGKYLHQRKDEEYIRWNMLKTTKMMIQVKIIYQIIKPLIMFETYLAVGELLSEIQEHAFCFTPKFIEVFHMFPLVMM